MTNAEFDALQERIAADRATAAEWRTFLAELEQRLAGVLATPHPRRPETPLPCALCENT